MTLKLSIEKPPIEYRQFTRLEWSVYPKDHFQAVIRSWCEKHGFVEYVNLGETIPAKLPYRLKGEFVEAAEDFLGMCDRRRARQSSSNQ